jgi:tetratricopeptide (TPR) repeat protein
MLEAERNTKTRGCWGWRQKGGWCRRRGEWWLYCPEHKSQPLKWLWAFITIGIFTIGAGLVQYYSFFFPPVFEQTQGPKGELAQKATLSGFEQELRDAAADLAARAKVHFEAAEEDYKEHRYKDAAERYQKSIGLLPTMSAYLNCGNALMYVSEFGKAEAAYLAGLQVARKPDHKDFEALFLIGLGAVYADQGEWEEALRFHQEALALFKQHGSLLGQANTLSNIGSVFAYQGKESEAVEWLTQAQTLYLQYGLNTPGLQIVGQTLDRLRSADKPV